MPYFPNTPDDQQEMLRAIGASSIDELFEMVPAEVRLGRELALPPGLGEMELTARMTELAGRNTPAGQGACFLGAGSYDHFIPAVVDFVASRSEFTTAYTPYQAEASQGTLQAVFQHQTMVTELTGMDVSNASLYDGAAAAAEAVLMALSLTRRHGRAVVAGSVHPEYRQVLATYLANFPTELVTLDAPQGTVLPEEIEKAVDDRTACVLLQQPNFFGCLEQVEAAAEIAHAAGALLVVAVDPISLGLLKRPGDCGADIVVAEGQSLGIPMSYGGPYLGMLACRQQHVRRMPGRVVGQTLDRRGRRCFVLTMQTREQHIRREKATSNVCTDEALMALRASVYLAVMGPRGLRRVAELCLHKARYAASRLAALDGWELAFARPTFKEFVVRRAGGGVELLVEAAAAQGIFSGVPIGRWYPGLSDCLLVAVTEKRTKEEIDRLAEVLGQSQ